jgi:predicted GNAT family acetyltransferase
MSVSPALDIRHDEAGHRFVATAEGVEAVLEYHPVDERTLDYAHTFVPPAMRGGGIASQLTEFALRHAQDRGFRIIPSCPFVGRYIERHPEFAPLVA